MTVNQCHFGDCRDSMRQMIANGVKVQMCVTSPPYFGLRDYGHHGQLGLEATPHEYVANMVEVFSLVRELLADDGTLWLNLGDSYAGYHGNKNAAYDHAPSNKKGYFEGQRKSTVGMGVLKSKDLIGIPWRLAFALQEDGWYLRQDLIWHKPNPMPESVTDRCTKSHEYLFLLSKSARYYFDHEAIKEPAKWERWGNQTVKKEQQGTAKWIGDRSKDELQAIGKKNKRSVWTIATKPYKGAHFATFPPDLITPCILAGAPVGAIVLDPFLGSGTTAQVAHSLDRRWIGCELNAGNHDLQARRLAQSSTQLELTTARPPDKERLYEFDQI